MIEVFQANLLANVITMSSGRKYVQYRVQKPTLVARSLSWRDTHPSPLPFSPFPFQALLHQPTPSPAAASEEYCKPLSPANKTNKEFLPVWTSQALVTTGLVLHLDAGDDLYVESTQSTEKTCMRYRPIRTACKKCPCKFFDWWRWRTGWGPITASDTMPLHSACHF